MHDYNWACTGVRESQLYCQAAIRKSSCGRTPPNQEFKEEIRVAAPLKDEEFLVDSAF